MDDNQTQDPTTPVDPAGAPAGDPGMEMPADPAGAPADAPAADPMGMPAETPAPEVGGDQADIGETDPNAGGAPVA